MAADVAAAAMPAPVKDRDSAGPDFRALFESLPSPHMVLNRDFDFVDANAAYCQVVERPRESLVGRNLFELFPEPGESGRRLRASLESVRDGACADTLALIPYPITLSNGRIETRYWTAVHTPLIGADGRTEFIVQNTVDVTELQRLKEMAYGPGGANAAQTETSLFQRAREIQEMNRVLAEESQGLRDLFMQAPGFMTVLAGEDLVFVLVNNAYQQLIGHRQLIGKPLEEALPEVRDQGFLDLLRQVMRTREPFIGHAISVMLQRSANEPLEERFLDFIYQPIARPSGEVWGVFVEGSDVTDRVLAERQQKLLLDELNHRVKNTLATVQAIAAQTLRNTDDPQAFRETFESRLMALSATHDLLTQTSWRSAALRDVVQVEFRPYDPARYLLTGPDVDLAPSAALTLGLLFHELATNAAKYGALSNATGVVAVSWRLEGDGDLMLDWIERGGPSVAQPTRRGFGSRLIERSLKGQMGGSATLEFAASGLRCRVSLPLKGA